MFASAGMPVCRKVESPMTASTGLAAASPSKRLHHAVRHAERGAHRDDAVHRVPRLAAAERVAADVAADDGVLELPEPEVHAHVRAAGAQGRRTREDARRFGRRAPAGRLATEQARHGPFDHRRRHLALRGQQILAVDREPRGLQFAFHDRFDFPRPRRRGPRSRPVDAQAPPATDARSPA